MPPTASNRESDEKASDRTPPIEWILAFGSHVYMIGVSSVASCRPFAKSHTTFLPTRSPVATYRPSGEIAQAYSIDGK